MSHITPPAPHRNRKRAWTVSQIVDIRSRAAQGESFITLADEYRVAASTIANIAYGQTHRDWPGEITAKCRFGRTKTPSTPTLTPFGHEWANAIDELVAQRVEEMRANGELLGSDALTVSDSCEVELNPAPSEPIVETVAESANILFGSIVKIRGLSNPIELVSLGSEGEKTYVLSQDNLKAHTWIPTSLLEVVRPRRWRHRQMSYSKTFYGEAIPLIGIEPNGAITFILLEDDSSAAQLQEAFDCLGGLNDVIIVWSQGKDGLNEVTRLGHSFYPGVVLSPPERLSEQAIAIQTAARLGYD